jgi:hypothetical protein
VEFARRLPGGNELHARIARQVVAEATMLAFIRNVIAGVMFVGVFGLMLGKPFVPADLRAWLFPLATVLAVSGFGAILVANKVACGVFFPGKLNAAIRDGHAPGAHASRARRAAGYGIIGVAVVYGLVKLFVVAKSSGGL